MFFSDCLGIKSAIIHHKVKSQGRLIFSFNIIHLSIRIISISDQLDLEFRIELSIILPLSNMSFEENSNPNLLTISQSKQVPPQSRFAEINEDNGEESFSDNSEDIEMNELEEEIENRRNFRHQKLNTIKKKF